MHIVRFCPFQNNNNKTVFLCSRSANYHQASGVCELSEMDRITLAGTSAFQPTDGKRFYFMLIYKSIVFASFYSANFYLWLWLFIMDDAVETKHRLL